MLYRNEGGEIQLKSIPKKDMELVREAVYHVAHRVCKLTSYSLEETSMGFLLDRYSRFDRAMSRCFLSLLDYRPNVGEDSRTILVRLSSGPSVLLFKCNVPLYRTREANLEIVRYPNFGLGYILRKEYTPGCLLEGYENSNTGEAESLETLLSGSGYPVKTTEPEPEAEAV